MERLHYLLVWKRFRDITCSQGHYMWSECMTDYLQDQFFSPTWMIPLKCSSCPSVFEKSQIEKYFTPNQKETYEAYSELATLDKKEYRVHICPYACGYPEVVKIEDDCMPIFICRREGCKKVSCKTCWEEMMVKNMLIKHFRIFLISSSFNDFLGSYRNSFEWSWLEYYYKSTAQALLLLW